MIVKESFEEHVNKNMVEEKANTGAQTSNENDYLKVVKRGVNYLSANEVAKAPSSNSIAKQKNGKGTSQKRDSQVSRKQPASKGNDKRGYGQKHGSVDGMKRSNTKSEHASYNLLS